MAFTYCTSIKQIQEVLRNYDGEIVRDRNGEYWMECDEEVFCGERQDAIRVCNQYFKKRGWQKA